MSDCEEEVPMRDFIDEYKKMPELWNTKLEIYKNKNIKKRSYERLLIQYKKIKNNATVDDVKKKIGNMRTCYRRELKRYIQSDRSGAGADDIYVPKLWYFEMFSFLRDLEIPLSGRSNFSSEEDEEPTCNSNKKHQQNKYTPKKACAVDLRTAFLKKASEHLDLSVKKQAQDAPDIYASGWACMMREMEPDQQLFAKQAIDEIVLLGRLGKLSLNYLQVANSFGTSGNLSEASTSSSGSPFLQNLSEPSTEYCVSVGSPDIAAVPFIRRPSATNSGQRGQFTPQAAVPFIRRPVSTNSGQTSQFTPQVAVPFIRRPVSTNSGQTAQFTPQVAVPFIRRPVSTNSGQTAQFTPQVAVPLISPALSTNSGQLSPQEEYSSIYELFTDTQFQ